MCEYCTNAETGDDYNALIVDTVSLGIAGELLMDVVICRGEQGKPELSLMGCMASASDGSTQKSIEIRYCPICGRKL